MADPQRWRTGNTLATKFDVLEVNPGNIVGTTDGQIRKTTNVKSTMAAMLVFAVARPGYTLNSEEPIS